MKTLTHGSLWTVIIIFVVITGLIRLHNTTTNKQIKDWITPKENTDDSKDSVGVKETINRAYYESLRFDKCTTAIRDSLKHPLSFDHDAGTTKHQYNIDNMHYIVRFRFYADNGFRDSIYSEGACAFNENHELIKQAISEL